MQGAAGRRTAGAEGLAPEGSEGAVEPLALGCQDQEILEATHDLPGKA